MYKVIFGDSQNMNELKDGSIHLMVTSPPYYNAPFDYPGLFRSYKDYLKMLQNFGKELYRVMAPGRIAAFVTDDMLIKGRKYPIVADTTRIMMDTFDIMNPLCLFIFFVYAVNLSILTSDS